MTQDELWESSFAALVSFKRKYRHVDGPFSSGYRALGWWISNQRRLHRDGKLDPTRARRLELIGLRWEGNRAMRGLDGRLSVHGFFVPARSGPGALNANYLQLLQDFFSTRGHFHVLRSDDSALNTWVTRARRRLLGANIERALRRLGFPFTAEAWLWERRFAKISDRVRAGLGFKVGSPTAIGPWMVKQRHLAATKRLTPTRRARLNAIGFFERPQPSRRR